MIPNERRKLDNSVPYQVILIVPALGVTIDMEVDAHGVPILPNKGDDILVDGTWFMITQREWNLETKIITLKAR